MQVKIAHTNKKGYWLLILKIKTALIVLVTPPLILPTLQTIVTQLTIILSQQITTPLVMLNPSTITS